jgi:hypothetical protein
VNPSFVTGIGVLEHGAKRRMLILVDIEKLISGTEMGLVDQVLQ